MFKKHSGWAVDNAVDRKHMTHPFHLAQNWVTPPKMKIENYMSHPIQNITFLVAYSPTESHFVYEIVVFFHHLKYGSESWESQ